jgi:hypothetical protein
MICPTPSPLGRLNAFQRVMLQWCELHPYNAIHTYRLSGPSDLPALRRAIQETFDYNGLGVVEIDPKGAWFRHEPEESGFPPELEVVGGDLPPEERLAEHVAKELNRPFERPRCRPFRFSVVETGPESHCVSLIYDHWAADSIGARLLMRHVLGRYLGLDIPENREAMELYPGTYREVFAHRLRGRRLAWPMLHSIGGWIDSRSSWRVDYSSAKQMAVGYAAGRVESGTVERMRRFARENEASVNDLFLAALCRAMVPYLPKRASRKGPRRLNLGTIVDTRSDARDDLGETLGTFLGYYTVRAVGDGDIGLGELTRRIAAITSVKKRRHGYLDSVVNMRLAGAIWPRLKPQSRAYFARRAMPLTAGVSNVHLRDTWIEQYGDGRIVDLQRAASTGPSLPLVILPTTFGDRMNVGICYRCTGFSQFKIDGILESFIRQLETLDHRSSLPRHHFSTHGAALRAS